MLCVCMTARIKVIRKITKTLQGHRDPHAFFEMQNKDTDAHVHALKVNTAV